MSETVTRRHGLVNDLDRSLKKNRYMLHNTIVNQVGKIGLAKTDGIVESFKRWFLFDCFSVETSRALSVTKLLEAIELAQDVDKKIALPGIMRKYCKYDNDKDLLVCTRGQIDKIYAVCLSGLGKNKKWMHNYIASTLHRKVNRFNITMNEADKVIKRLEQYEVNQYKQGKK